MDGSAYPEGADFSATVTEIRELTRVNGRPVFQIALDHSNFRVHTGPLPAGTLTAVARSGAVLIVPITAVFQDAAGELWLSTTKPLQPGTPVTARVFSGQPSMSMLDKKQTVESAFPTLDE